MTTPLVSPPRMLSGRGAGQGGVGWGARGRGDDPLPLSGEVHTDLLALASFQGVPPGLQLLPPVLRLRPGKRHHYVLRTCRPWGENRCWMGLWCWAAAPMRRQSSQEGCFLRTKCFLRSPLPLLSLPYSLARIHQQPSCRAWAAGCQSEA